LVILAKIFSEAYEEVCGLTSKLTPASGLPILCPQRKKRFAPNSRSGIFIVGNRSFMANTILVGAQWGDEGKGKIIDVLTESADVVVRTPVSYTHLTLPTSP
jgi:hypothetical protein